MTEQEYKKLTAEITTLNQKIEVLNSKSEMVNSQRKKILYYFSQGLYLSFKFLYPVQLFSTSKIFSEIRDLLSYIFLKECHQIKAEWSF